MKGPNRPAPKPNRGPFVQFGSRHKTAQSGSSFASFELSKHNFSLWGVPLDDYHCFINGTVPSGNGRRDISIGVTKEKAAYILRVACCPILYVEDDLDQRDLVIDTAIEGANHLFNNLSDAERALVLLTLQQNTTRSKNPRSSE